MQTLTIRSKMLSMKKHIETRLLPDQTTLRAVFIYPYDYGFLMACQAMKIRGLLQFGENPIKGKVDYLAFYADLTRRTPECYANYAMLVRDFYTEDLKKNFDKWFPFPLTDIKPAVPNPNSYMEARREIVHTLVEKYRGTTSPLEFYGSLHMAEGVALFMEVVKNGKLKGAINADEQGMAKTRQAIIGALESGKRRILVVAPKTPRIATWPREIKLVNPKLQPGEHLYRFIDHKIFYGPPALFSLLQWDALRRLPDEFFKDASQYDLLILDEAHKIKHPASARSIAADKTAKDIPHIFPLTGTPVTKRPKDLFHLLKLMEHPLGKNEWQYLTRYCGKHTDSQGWSFASSKNLHELHNLTRDCLIRREKSQTNLPPKVRYPERITFTDAQMEAADKMWDDYCKKNAAAMASPKFPLVMVKFNMYKKFFSLLKVPYIVDWAEDLLEAGEKLVIFTGFTDVFDAYMKHFQKVGVVGINGATPDKKRLEAKEGFQSDEKIRVFIGNIQAAGEGIDLTAASYLAFNDFSWLPTDQLQAEDRIHRGGQDYPCSIHYFVADASVEDDVFEDFLRSEQVVKTITNRRDSAGNIKSTEWKGEMAGITKPENMVEKTSFDWSDAGQEPPPGWVPPRNTVMAQQMENFEDLLYQQLCYLKKQPQGFMRFDTIFAVSVIDWYQGKGFYTTKQQDAIQKVLGRYVRRLTYFRPEVKK